MNNPGLGAEFEVLLPAYLALKFFKNREIKDFELRSNVKGFEKFDDVLMDIKMEDDSQHHFAIQLKRKERENGKLIQDSFHTRKDFNLERYCEAYHKLASDEHECIIFTNANFDSKKIKDVKKFTMASSDNDFVNNLLNSNTGNGNVYKFEINEETQNKEKFEKFFQHFFLFVAQKNTKELEEEIINIFRNEYAAKDVKVSTEFINLFRKWHQRQFTNDALDRKTLSIHLVHLLLGNFMIKPINGTIIIRNKRLHFLEECIRNFDVTIIEDSELKLINELGKCEQENFLPSYIEELLKIRANNYKIFGNDLVDQCISRLAKEYKFIVKSQKKLNAHEKMKVFNYLLGKPFIIHFNKDSKYKIFKVLNMDLRGDVKIKFVLLGIDIAQTQFGNLKSFKTLHDLCRYNNKLYQEVIKETEVTLQGKEKIKLEEITKISGEIEKIIQVKHLCQEDVKFGEELEELPEYYIPRTVSAFVLSEEEVLEEFIKKNCVLVVDCETDYQYLAEIARRKSLEIINIDHFFKKIKIIKEGNRDDNYLVVTKGMYMKEQFDQICSMTDNNVCFLKVNKERQFILIKSKSDVLNGMFLKETEIPFNFCAGINVLCAEPGMGKTSRMKNFRNKCSSDQWAVFLQLKQFGSLFKEDNLQSGEILERLLCKVNEDIMIKNMRNIFIRKKKISLFLDGLDELDNECIDNVLFFIKKLQKDGFNVWLSCRNNLKDKVETELNLFSIDINQVHQVLQKEYINNRLRSHSYTEDQITEIIKNIFGSINIQNNSTILGIPLQLFMITQIFIDDKNKYSKLNEKQFILTKLYSNYFKGKIKHTLQKNGLANDFDINGIAKPVLEQYKISALRTCLSNEDFKNLNLTQHILERDEKFINAIRNGDNYGIIQNVNKDKTVSFVHHTHAEYFAAVYLSENIDKVRILGESFLTQKYNNLRLLFDIKLAENSPLHLSILHDNLDQFQEYLANSDYNNIRDKGGRTALHLVCIHGTRYSPLEFRKERNKFYYDISPNIKEEKTSFKTMTDKLVKLHPSMTEDEIFKWNEFQYATKCLCLYPLQAILQQQGDPYEFSYYKKTLWFRNSKILKRNSFIKDVETFLNNDKGAIAYYAAKLGYQDLMKVLFVASDFSIKKMKFDQKQYTLLHTASTEGHKEVALLLIKKNCQLNDVDSWGDTSLHYACLRGQNEIVKLLIQNKANVNVANNYDYTPLNYAYQKRHYETVRLLIQNNAKEDNNHVLHDACKKGYYQIVLFLVENNADINRADEDGETPLHWACSKGHKETVLLLIDNDANVNSVDRYGDTPLHWACISGHKEIAFLLIRNNANINSVNRFGKTPLHLACSNGHNKTALLLVLNDADINNFDNDGDTPIHCAFKNGHSKIAALLIQLKAKYGDTPLHWACKKGEKEIALLLIRNKADINCRDKNGDTPIHCAFKNGHSEIAIFLIQLKAKYGDTPLHWACKKGEKEIALLLIRNKADINCRDKNGGTPIHCAFKNGHSKIAALLIQLKAKYGDTPLHCACKKGEKEIALLLIRNKADINCRDKNGDTPIHCAFKNGHSEIAIFLIQLNAKYSDTPLHWACEKGERKIALLLIQNNANVNSTNAYGNTPLHYACMYGHKNITSLLIQNNANVNSVNENGNAPLHYAFMYGYKEIALLLIHNNANANSVDKFGHTPLDNACMYGHKDIVLLLIQNNANVNSTNKYGNTSLHYAFRYGHNEIARLLIQNNANVNSVNENGFTPLQHACWNGDKKTALLLIQNNANVNSSDKYGNTPLHCASRNGHNRSAHLLIQNNANVNSINKYNTTPLHYACMYGHKIIAHLLIQNNACVNSTNIYGATPLHYSCMNGHKETALLLIKNNANVNSVNENGTTPLHYACMNRHREIALLLIQNNVNVNSVDEDDDTPLHYACWHGHKQTALLLIQNGANVNSVNKNGYAPLQLAPSFVRKEITALLEKKSYA